MAISDTDPLLLAQQWVEAWNRRDPEWVLALFAEDCVFTSPTAARVVPTSGGVITGKTALREYWVAALAGNPSLLFTLQGVYVGVDAVVIHYSNQAGVLLNEVLVFRGGLVALGFGTHASSEDSPSGSSRHRPPSSLQLPWGSGLVQEPSDG